MSQREVTLKIDTFSKVHYSLETLTMKDKRRQVGSCVEVGRGLKASREGPGARPLQLHVC